MARYVVLYLENNEEAEAVVEVVKASDLSVAPVGLLPAPTLFCDDTFGSHGQKKAGYFKGPKYGWWVCSVCGKPTPSWGQSFRAVISSAHNLLEDA